MSSYLRKVRTASGATAVQVVAKERGVRRIVEHLGPAHDQAELAALMRSGAAGSRRPRVRACWISMPSGSRLARPGR